MSSATPGREDEAPSVNRLIVTGLLTRIITDSGVQAFFPFLGIISQGTGISETVLSRLVGLRASTGLLSPLFGVIADRRGYRLVMSGGLLAAGLGYLLIAASQSWPLFALGMLLAGTGTFAFAPNLTAYLSAQLPFHRRARGIGIVEYAWALSGMVGLSLIGQPMAVTSWRVPFIILGVGLIAAGLYYRTLPAARHTEPAENTEPTTKQSLGRRLARFFDLGTNRRSAWGVLVGALFIAMSGFTLILTYGIFLQREYGLDAAALGRIAFILGVCDIVGSGLVSIIGDWVGKRRSVLWGSGLSFVGLLLLPLFNVSLVGAVVGLFLARGAFEFAIVSNAVLQSEQLPQQRGKMLTLGAASTLLGSTIVGFTAVEVYDTFGIWGIALNAAVLIAIAFLVILLFARESG